MALPVLGSLGARTASFFGSSATRAAAGGLGAGMLVDDVPVIGDTLDPTEGGNGGGFLGGSIIPFIVGGIIVWVLIDTASDI